VGENISIGHTCKVFI